MRNSIIPHTARRRVSFVTQNTTKPKRIQYKKSITIENGYLANKEISKSTADTLIPEPVQEVIKPVVVEVENIAGNTEVEKKLNYNILPSKSTQMKLDYLLTPYNDAKYIYKFMNFNDEMNIQNMSLEDA